VCVAGKGAFENSCLRLFPLRMSLSLCPSSSTPAFPLARARASHPGPATFAPSASRASPATLHGEYGRRGRETCVNEDRPDGGVACAHTEHGLASTRDRTLVAAPACSHGADALLSRRAAYARGPARSRRGPDALHGADALSSRRRRALTAPARCSHTRARALSSRRRRALVAAMTRSRRGNDALPQRRRALVTVPARSHGADALSSRRRRARSASARRVRVDPHALEVLE
jgi:hypothetical protein